MSLQLKVAVSSMALVGELGNVGQLDALGVSKADYARLVGDAPWTASERNRMTATLHSLIMGSVDIMGLSRFKVPAEYMAAGIAVFVAPVNVHVACQYAPAVGEAEEMGRGADRTKVLPEQLFALVVQLYDTDMKVSARYLFEKKCGIEIKKVADQQPQSKGK